MGIETNRVAITSKELDAKADRRVSGGPRYRG